MIRRTRVAWGLVGLVSGLLLVLVLIKSVSDYFLRVPTPREQSRPAGFPRTDGSDSVDHFLRLVAAKRLGLMYQWENTPEGERVVRPAGPSGRTLSGAEDYVWNRMPFSNTRQAYVNLILRRTDLIVVVRAPSKSEGELARTNGVELRIQPVALDAMVILLNRDNPVDALNLDQLRRIYAGEIRDWSELGGKGPIIAHHRRSGSVSQSMLEEVMGGKLVGSASKVVKGDGEVLAAVSEHSGAIGFNPHYRGGGVVMSERVKVVAVDGIRPLARTLAARQYPLTMELLVVVRADTSEHSEAGMLRAWLLSPEGQLAVDECGYARVN